MEKHLMMLKILLPMVIELVFEEPMEVSGVGDMKMGMGMGRHQQR